MSLTAAQLHSQILKNSVILTGAPRSGTTILGKLLGSLEKLEYHFEPPTLYTIAAAHSAGEISTESAKMFLQIYFSEDLFLETVHGRLANMRPSDDSQIFNRMYWSELNDRWTRVGNRTDAILRIAEQNLRFAVKMPNLFDSMDLLESVCPDPVFVISVRNGIDVVRSIIRKGWVSQEGLNDNLWPYLDSSPNTINIPYWVPSAYRSRWTNLSEASRACVMWAHHAELGLAVVEKRRNTPRPLIEVRYEKLLEDPSREINELAQRLGTKNTLHTQKWIDSISVPESIRGTRTIDFAEKTDPDILNWFTQVNAAWGY